MNIFIDTAVRGCNIALFNEDGIVKVAQEDIERGHAETLLILYERIMKAAHCSSDNLENIYVTIGPGSFTGLRVGLTVARFIGFSIKIPVYGITTFQAFSAGVKDNSKQHLVLIETKRSDYYCQLFSSNHKEINEAQCLSKELVSQLFTENNDIIFTGDAIERFKTEIGDTSIPCSIQTSVNIKNVIDAINHNVFELSMAEAFYIREADVSMPK